MATTVDVVGGTLIVEMPGVGGGPAPQPPGSVAPPIHLPDPPPGIWPPPVNIWPPTPLPPDFPMPPGSIWPPVRPVRPDQGLPRPPGSPDQGLPGQPPAPDQGLPGGPASPSHPIVSQKMLVAIVALSAGGPRVIGYTVVDPSLSPGHELPPHPEPK